MSLTRTSGGARSTASVTDLRSLAPADPFAPEASGFARVRLMPLAASPGLRASGSAAVLASPLASYTMSPVISSASVRKLKPLSDERETIRKEGFMPGYTGYVQNLWMVQARSYSTATRTALAQDPITLHVGDYVPPGPQSSDLVRVPKKRGHIPGYTGFVPGRMAPDRVGMTYGDVSMITVDNGNVEAPRAHEEMMKASLRAYQHGRTGR